MIFNGQVKITGGQFKTWYQLIIAAIAARDWDSQEQEDAAVSRWRQAICTHIRFKPDVNMYTIDAFKGIINGVVTQADWAAGDFTASPGGGMLFEGGIEYGPYSDVELMNTVVYAAADTVIMLNVVVR